jgi:hypothetical protein
MVFSLIDKVEVKGELQAAHEGGKGQLSPSKADALTIDPRGRQHGKARQQKPIGDGPASGNFRNLTPNDKPR